MSELYAKSQPRLEGIPWPTLISHLQDVVDAAHELFDPTRSPRLCNQWLRFFRLDSSSSDRFCRTLRAAAALHDLGKANDGFQAAVGNPAYGKGEQGIRHEHLSALLIHQQTVWDWLNRDQSTDWPIVLSAVLTHHQKCLDKSAIISLSAARKAIKVVTDLPLRHHIGLLLGRDAVLPAGEEYWSFDTQLPAREFKMRLTDWMTRSTIWTAN